MSQEADSQRLKLPDRGEITLCEAVTAVVYGKVMDAEQQMFDGKSDTEERSARAKALIERLREAAYAGRIQFRALKTGDNPADGHKDINRLYFSDKRGFRWNCDQIWSRALSRDRPRFRSQPPNFTMDWHNVHLDREGFESLLRDMGVSVQQSPDADTPDKRTILSSGAPGRPTSKHLLLLMAQRKLDDGHYPDTLAEFSRQLQKDLANAHPEAPPMTPKTISNAIRGRWHERQKPPKITDPS